MEEEAMVIIEYFRYSLVSRRHRRQLDLTIGFLYFRLFCFQECFE